MSAEAKLKAFNYVVKKLLDWHIEANPSSTTNDLSKLKVTKLLFFVTAISCNSNDEGLLSTFENFVALPYGHVEGDLQDSMHNSEIFIIDRERVSFKPDLEELDFAISKQVEEKIDNAVKLLRRVNNNLINYKAFDLVELSHRWASWKTMYSLARKHDKFSMRIPKELIMNEIKIFSA